MSKLPIVDWSSFSLVSDQLLHLSCLILQKAELWKVQVPKTNRQFVALDSLGVTNPFFWPAPAQPLRGPQNSQVKRTEGRTALLRGRALNEKVPAMRFPNIKKGCRPAPVSPLLPLHLAEWTWVLGLQRCQTPGFTDLQNIWKKTKNQTAGYQLLAHSVCSLDLTEFQS